MFKPLAKIGTSREVSLPASYLNDLKAKGKLNGFELEVNGDNVVLKPSFDKDEQDPQPCITMPLQETPNAKPTVEGSHKRTEREVLKSRKVPRSYQFKNDGLTEEERLQKLINLTLSRD